MKILGIETSCDETAAAIVEDGRKILSNVVATSSEMHAKTGGVIPENAARQQLTSIIPVVESAILNAKCQAADIDAIAVTVGPGLIGSLLVGVETAKTLSYAWDKPIIPVNHLLGHIYANWLKGSEPKFPVLALVVSGGHTDLVLMKSHSQIGWVGGTRDDAAGEAFDKTARLLGLPYPGGPNLSKLADEYLKSIPEEQISLSLFPRPMVHEDNFDWSFSGLKTAVLREVEGKNLKIEKKAEIAAEIQEAIVDSLVLKVIRAIEKYRIEFFLLSGGVAANSRLSKKFVNELNSKKLPTTLHVPEPKLCTDNASFIAAAAFYHNNPIDWRKVSANPNLIITSKPEIAV